jgi:hypothetical protein
MEQFFTSNVRWLIPLILLLLQVLMKLFIADTYDKFKVWSAFLYIPVQTGFLALSFAATVLMSAPHKASLVFAVCLFYIMILIVCIVLWRQTSSSLVVRDVIIASLITIINFALTLPMLAYSVSLIVSIYAGSNKH